MNVEEEKEDISLTSNVDHNTLSRSAAAVRTGQHRQRAPYPHSPREREEEEEEEEVLSTAYNK